jgi:chromosomal replication initiation ATPase DnaA
MSGARHVSPTRLRALLEETSARTGFGVHRLVGPEVADDIAQARFAFAWAAQQGLASSTVATGQSLCRHHTTIIHAIRRAEQLRASDDRFRALTDRLVAFAMEKHRA